MHPPSLRSTIGPGGEGAENTRKLGLGKACAAGGSVAGQEPSGVVDFGYLEGFMAGDRQVIGEVLALFEEQAGKWRGALAEGGADWRDVVHTIKGAARGIGANALGDACAACEANGPQDLPGIQAALDAALAEIAAYRAG
jgi:HPt (histidine-containing phosphotransfer) domain-containing protein